MLSKLTVFGNSRKSLYLRFFLVFNLSILATVILVTGALIVTNPDLDIITLAKSFSPIILISVVALFLFSTANIMWFRHSVIKPINSIEGIINDIQKGNYHERIQLTTNDEFSDIAKTFNDTMDKLLTVIQTEEERERTQKNIIRFLSILSAASEGDLTQKAAVTSDVFGSLADAFNLMVEGLADLLKEVKHSADDANSRSLALSYIIQQLEGGASMQMGQIESASSAVNESAVSALAITDRTKTGQTISGNGIQAIERGTKIVSDSIDGMHLIRATVKAINKRMKLLSEKLMEIGTISKLISDIADKTNLLALNASIEAARAGEQSKGFVIIAEEIRGLAERSAKSTKQIGEIINSIQSEAGSVTKHLEDETSYVEMETNMATETGSVFEEIAGIIKNVGSIMSEINDAAEGQRGLTSKVVTSMNEVNQVSEQVMKAVHDLTDISKSLSESSQRLLTSTGRFKF